MLFIFVFAHHTREVVIIDVAESMRLGPHYLVILFLLNFQSLFLLHLLSLEGTLMQVVLKHLVAYELCKDVLSLPNSCVVDLRHVF